MWNGLQVDTSQTRQRENYNQRPTESNSICRVTVQSHEAAAHHHHTLDIKRKGILSNEV